MGGAPVVIILISMAFPILFVLLAVLLDVLVVFWVIYRLWHDEWSVGLWRTIHRVAHMPRWHVIRIH